MNDGRAISCGISIVRSFINIPTLNIRIDPRGTIFFRTYPGVYLRGGGGLFEGWSIGFFLENPKPNFQKVFE
jgi:hypothetical protein